jgi:cell fate regulator YaaT (PSP1 superfamily)
MKKWKKLAAGELQIEVDCSRKNKLRKVLKKAFPEDKHKMRFHFNPIYTSLWLCRCEIHEHMWSLHTSPRLNVKSIKLSQYGKNGDPKN